MTRFALRAPRVRLLCEERLHEVLSSQTRFLDVGSGGRRLAPGGIGIDIGAQAGLDLRGDAQRLPFRDGAFRLCVCTSVLEHVVDPMLAIKEIARVTQPEGQVWIEVPFLYHFHTSGESDRHDYTRWTAAGFERLMRVAGFEIIEFGMNVGPGTALRLLAAESLALLFWGSRHSGPYYLTRTLVNWGLIWLSWLDRAMARSPLAHRAAGGFYAYARKKDQARVSPNP